ncbi:hypothetical protein VTN31DRAFT_5824 [Thermomyces dupontii]|uniref:uncharacterized protein n=1 Tax=Talaromyces thermophilus TaxID=28565 RepID=UPI00374253EA
MTSATGKSEIPGAVIQGLSQILLNTVTGKRMISVSFTALVLNELLMVAIAITTWHPIMIFCIVGTALVYIISIPFLGDYFDLEYVITLDWLWRVVAVCAASIVPVWIGKIIRSSWHPPSYRKLGAAPKPRGYRSLAAAEHCPQSMDDYWGKTAAAPTFGCFTEDLLLDFDPPSSSTLCADNPNNISDRASVVRTNSFGSALGSRGPTTSNGCFTPRGALVQPPEIRMDEEALFDYIQELSIGG